MYSGEPKSLKDALNNPLWLEAMHEELRALGNNNSWSSVPCTPFMNIVDSEWVYKTKLSLHGSIEHLNTHLVAQGYTTFWK